MYKNKGFILPMIMTFIIIISIVGTSLVQVAIQANGSAVRHTQVQIAHIASKAAIDYATEQYDLNADYDGTTEQDLFSNNFYRATIEVVVLFSQGPSAKRVQGIGRVYIPKTSSNARVVRDIKATIIRSGEHVDDENDEHDDDHNDTTNPESFNPLLWLDANKSDTLYKSNTANTQTIDSLYGNGNSVVEERGSDASKKQGKLSSGGDDLEMSWDGNSKGHQTIGLRFKSIITPQAAVVQNSYIQFTTDETKSAGAVQLLVQGVSQDNPGAWSGDYAVTNAPKTVTSITWQPANWNIVGSSGANERVDVTAIVQELVDRAGWANGNSMAFSISWITGNGVRTAEKGKNGSDPKLFIQWAGGGGLTKATADGDSVDQWYDRSSNKNNAVFTYGTHPILKLNQINGKNAVRFSSNGALLSAISSLSDRELVAFMVMAPRVTSSTNARFLSVMNSAQNDDNNTPDGLVPFMRSGSSSTLQQVYDNTTGRTIVNGIDGNWGAFTSRMSDLYSERLLKNSNPDNYNPDFTVNYTVDQIYLGGRRSGSVGADYADMDVAEVLVYDRAFVCSELQLIENYFKSKYNFSYVDKNPCP